MKQLITGLIKYIGVTALVVSVLACGGPEERKLKYLEKGKTYLKEKNYDKAKIEFKNVLQIDPKFADAYLYMGELEESRVEIAKAVNNYRKAIELDPSLVNAKLKLARIYVIAGTEQTIKEAKLLIDEIEKSGASSIMSELISATIEYKVGSKEKATKLFESIVKKDKKIVDGVIFLASIYSKNEDYEKARLLLKSASANNPKNIQIKLTLAQLYANKIRDMESGERILLEVAQLEPNNYSLQIGLAAFYSRVHKYDKAEKILRDSIKQDDEDVGRYLKLVDFLSTRVSLKQAETELKNAVKNKPDIYALKFALVKFYKVYGHISEAKEILTEIVKAKSYEVEGVKARTLLARYHLEEGDSKGAKKYVDEVLAEYPNDSDALLIRSKLALSNFDAVVAINGLRTVVKNDPKNAEASLLLAQAHELNKESALAENVLKKSIEANPVNDQVHVNYARYLGSKGRVDEALIVVDKALMYFKKSYDLLDIKLKIVSSQGKKLEVLALLDMMELANNHKAEVNIIRGKFYVSKQEVNKAVEQFEEAYKKSRDKYKPLELITKTYLASKQPEKAIERLQSLIDKEPKDAIANLLLGHVYFSQKKIQQAREKFLIASDSAEKWMPPYKGLAETYLVEKKLDKVLAVYQNAVSKLDDKVPAQLKIAAIYETQEKFSDAIKIYQQILLENEGNKLAENNYASLLLDYGNESDVPKALELAKGFEKIQQAALQDTLGWAYAKTGESAKAVEILKPVVEKAPKIAVFRYHLGYALFYMGDKAAAKSHLEIASSSKQKFPGKKKAEELLKSI